MKGGLLWGFPTVQSPADPSGKPPGGKIFFEKIFFQGIFPFPRAPRGGLPGIWWRGVFLAQPPQKKPGVPPGGRSPKNFPQKKEILSRMPAGEYK